MFAAVFSWPLFMFGISMCATPGPNNIMLAASGVQFGFRRSLPHILGIELGMVVMFVLNIFGLGVLFDLFSALSSVLKIIASLYLVYFAFKTATAKRRVDPNHSEPASKPMTFIQAVLFQFINPKAWMIIASALATFTKPGQDYAASAVAVVGMFAIVCIPCISLWAGFGNILGNYLQHQWAFRSFSIFMGCLCLYSIVMLY